MPRAYLSVSQSSVCSGHADLIQRAEQFSRFDHRIAGSQEKDPVKILLALFVTTSVALLSFGCSDSNSGASSYCQNSGESVPTELDGYLMGLDVESGS